MMKRLACLTLAVVLLVGAAGCRKEPDSSQPANEAVVYTAFPEALKAEAIGTLPQVGMVADGGLYYSIGKRYGIMSFDGSADSGAIYAQCRPLGNYFLVAKETGVESDIKTLNTAGVVDAWGNVLVPLAYASVVAVDDRFVRVAELTEVVSTRDEAITEFTSSTGDEVHCAGNWYMYDLTTGKKVPGATGHKRYAAYSYGGKYVKYVTDDKKEYVVTPEGDELPAEAIHLKNGYYALEATHGVYDAYGKQLFTYDPNGYVPCDDQQSGDYIVAKKTVDGKDSYVVMDLTGQVLSGEMPAEPKICGSMLLMNKKVCNLKGEVLFPSECNALYMDAVTKQAWVFSDSVTKEKIMFDKDGNVLYRSGIEDVTFNVNNFDMHKKDGENESNHLTLKDQSYTLKGTAVGPWLVTTTNEDGTYNLVETISGQTLLSNYAAFSVGLYNGEVMYVYAIDAERTYTVYRIS